MKNFSDFLRKLKERNTKAKVGFASIHKKDKELDKLLNIKPPKPAANTVKEDIENKTGIENPFHQAYLEKIKSMSPQRLNDVFNKENHAHDAEEFAHHHQLNALHETEGPHFRNHTGEPDPATGYEKHTHEPLKEYTRTSHQLNHYLIAQHRQEEHTNSEWLKKHVQEHDRVLSQKTHHPGNALVKPTIVHSGAGKNMGELLNHTKIGEHVHFPAYTSTSTHPQMAHSFATPGDKGIKHILHFHLPTGYTKGRHVENISANPSEHEMILHKGQTFRKVGHHVEREESTEENAIHHHHFVPVEEHHQTASTI